MRTARAPRCPKTSTTSHRRDDTRRGRIRRRSPTPFRRPSPTRQRTTRVIPSEAPSENAPRDPRRPPIHVTVPRRPPMHSAGPHRGSDTYWQVFADLYTPDPDRIQTEDAKTDLHDEASPLPAPDDAPPPFSDDEPLLLDDETASEVSHSDEASGIDTMSSDEPGNPSTRRVVSKSFKFDSVIIPRFRIVCFGHSICSSHAPPYSTTPLNTPG